ncbi:MAG: hypothetical protein J7513_05560 [Solirubrobacteraceae bacterium]|nr:hypothetical protein [Solirubrobacteraceae bacterium]
MTQQLTLNDSGESVHDPRLSDEANLALTREVHAVLEGDAIYGGPTGSTWHPRAGATPKRRPKLLAAAADARIVVVPIALMLVVVAVIGTIGDTYVMVGVAYAALIVAVAMVAELIASMTREVEHVSPETQALLEAEGIVDPDRLFGDLLAERRAA